MVQHCHCWPWHFCFNKKWEVWDWLSCYWHLLWWLWNWYKWKKFKNLRTIIKWQWRCWVGCLVTTVASASSCSLYSPFMMQNRNILIKIENDIQMALQLWYGHTSSEVAVGVTLSRIAWEHQKSIMEAQQGGIVVAWHPKDIVGQGKTSERVVLLAFMVTVVKGNNNQPNIAVLLRH